MTTSALTAEIRLTWWWEALADIDAGAPQRGHPVTIALADAVRRRELPPALLRAMVEARFDVLDRVRLEAQAGAAWADEVGGSAAVLSAIVLGAGDAAPAARPAGAALSLAGLVREGAIDRPVGLELLREALVEANAAVKSLPPAAFPAVAAATLTRADLSGRPESGFGQRRRLLWAVVRGRL